MKIKAIYTVPTCQNPTRSIMSLKRRRQLIHFVQSNNILIIEDDPHRELALSTDQHMRKLPPTLKSLDTTGRVVYLKGFSKFLFPGLRLGIMAADQLVSIAHHHGIHFLPGSIFFPGQPELNHMRIC